MHYLFTVDSFKHPRLERRQSLKAVYHTQARLTKYPQNPKHPEPQEVFRTPVSDEQVPWHVCPDLISL